MLAQIVLRKDTLENWSSRNPVLSLGEPGIVLNSKTGEYKIGDGQSHWNDLPMFNGMGNGKKGTGTDSVIFNVIESNIASGPGTFVSGRQNNASGAGAFVCGGSRNVASGVMSIAGGSHAQAMGNTSMHIVAGLDTCHLIGDAGVTRYEVINKDPELAGPFIIYPHRAKELYEGKYMYLYKDHSHDIGVSYVPCKITKVDVLPAAHPKPETNDFWDVFLEFDKTLSESKPITKNDVIKILGSSVGSLSIAMQRGCSYGYGSIAMHGCAARGHESISFGDSCVSMGNSSVAFGANMIAENRGELAIGSNNKPDENPAPDGFTADGKGIWEANSTAFVIGAGGLHEHNSFRVTYQGKVYSDNTVIQPNADYAEMFEWLDGNKKAEDRVGFFVTLNGNKIVKANSKSNYILGAISAMPAMIGDAPMRWNNKFITDEWGRVVYEEVEVTNIEYLEDGTTVPVTRKEKQPKVNPDYDPNRSYKPREERQEWDAVGLLGKLLVRQDGTLKAGDFCKPNDQGMATKSNTGYYVMEVVNKNIVKILFR